MLGNDINYFIPVHDINYVNLGFDFNHVMLGNDIFCWMISTISRRITGISNLVRISIFVLISF